MAVIQPVPLVLASGSAIRAQMLKAVGLQFSVVPSSVNETAIKEKMRGDAPEKLAAELARAKAAQVAADYPDYLTVGADQLCVDEDGTIYDKPGTRERAETQLADLAGRTHRQISATCVMRGGEVVWEDVQTATLTMRALSAAEIAAYIRADQPLQSCGAYRFEGLGRHLFTRVDGDHDGIKGLPLVPLLQTLYRLDAIKFGS